MEVSDIMETGVNSGKFNHQSGKMALGQSFDKFEKVDYLDYFGQFKKKAQGAVRKKSVKLKN